MGDALVSGRAAGKQTPKYQIRNGFAIMLLIGVLNPHPERSGVTSSLQMFVGSTANGIVAGLITPLVMHSTVGLATASVLMMSLGLSSWVYIRCRWPDIGQSISHT